MLTNFAADFLSELRISKIPQIMVRVITRGGVGELSDPLVKRTNPAAPGSPPMYLEVTAQVTIRPIKHFRSDSNYGIEESCSKYLTLQANSANFSWRPPTQPNGNIDSYKVNPPSIDISC